MTNHTHLTSSSNKDHKSKNNDKLLELYHRNNSDFMPKNLTRCEFVLKVIQIQQLFVKNDQVKTVNKLLKLIQRTTSDFKSNKSN